jgi:energy-coupling factor transporter transmembrane protein EcfT
MDTQTAPTVSRGRLLAYRIIAGVFGVFVIISNLAFSVPQFFSDTDKVHSFHDLASMPAFLILLGFALIVMMLRPDDVVALRVAWAVVLGTLIAGLIGHDFISGSYYITLVVVGVLTILAPARSDVLRFGSPNVAMLSLAIIAAIPAIVFAWDNARMMLQGDPMHDVTGHWKYHHWSGVAASALSVVLAAIVVSFRSPGDRMWTWVVGFATMLFGLAGIIFSDAVRYPSSIGTLWGVGVFFVGLVYIVVAEVSGREEMETGARTVAP